jgi:signal peptidase I
VTAPEETSSSEEAPPVTRPGSPDPESPDPESPETSQPGGSGPTPSDTAAADGSKEPGKRRGGSFWKELPFLILIALVLALLIKTFLVQAFYIPSGSMENTLHVGDRVLVNKLIYRIRDIHRGEIVVFKGPESWQDSPEFTATPPSNPVARFFHDIGSALGVAAPSSKDFIKRVVGVAGDHVVCCDPRGRVTVNDRPLTEPYLFPGAKPSDTNFDITVPKGRLWVMGDHRNASADSRSHISDGTSGTIPTGNVIGRAFVRVWPPGDWGTLPVPDTFHQDGLAAAIGNPLALGFAGAVPATLLRRRVRDRRRRRSLRRPAA